jgi:hypothetical protein
MHFRLQSRSSIGSVAPLLMPTSDQAVIL